MLESSDSDADDDGKFGGPPLTPDAELFVVVPEPERGPVVLPWLLFDFSLVELLFRISSAQLDEFRLYESPLLV